VSGASEVAQFDVHRNANPATRDQVPYLLDVQAELLEDLATRVVVPLVSAGVTGRPIQHLNPEFVIEDVRVVMSTPELAGVPRRALGETVTTLAARRGDIVEALDFLFTGA